MIMKTSRSVYAWLSALLLLNLHPTMVLAQKSTFLIDEARGNEIQQGSLLVRQGNFTPIDAAFAKKDIEVLWGYFNGSQGSEVYHVFNKVTPAMLARATDNLERYRYRMVIARQEYAGNYLKQIPGHARLIGDLIENSASVVDMNSERCHWFECLSRLASDESIAQLGRFLFDKRNPDKGSKKYYMEPSANEFYAAVWLQTGLGDKSPLGRGDLRYGGDKKLREWWLTSPDAAPYRQGLLASSVTLPPDYPMVPEGAKKTLWSKMTGRVSQTGSGVNGWLLGTALLVLASISIWLAARRRKSA